MTKEKSDKNAMSVDMCLDLSW